MAFKKFPKVKYTRNFHPNSLPDQACVSKVGLTSCLGSASETSDS